MKRLIFEPINESMQIHTQDSLLDGMLAKNSNILMACGGKGLCATCHVHVTSGSDQLTPMTEREERTLGRITGCSPDSRLACQARVLGDGVVVQLPEGVYIERGEDLNAYLGKRAKTNILHPISGEVLVKKGKIITRSRIEELSELEVEVKKIRATNV